MKMIKMEKKEENNLSSCTIGGKEFHIQLCGKTICALSFVSLFVHLTQPGIVAAGYLRFTLLGMFCIYQSLSSMEQDRKIRIRDIFE